jgi:hypothetical protein
MDGKFVGFLITVQNCTIPLTEGIMARNAGHAPALYSGYLTGTWFN